MISSKNYPIKLLAVEACSSLEEHHGSKCDSSKPDWSTVHFSSLWPMLERFKVRFSGFHALHIRAFPKFTQLGWNSFCHDWTRPWNTFTTNARRTAIEHLSTVVALAVTFLVWYMSQIITICSFCPKHEGFRVKKHLCYFLGPFIHLLYLYTYLISR